MADTEPSKSNKRRLKAPSQSVREKAEKGQAEADKPVKKRRLKNAAQSAGKPLGKIGKVFNRQPFKFIGRILVPSFVRNAFKELQLVKWPNFRETRQLTFAVLAFAVVFCIIIGSVDYGLNALFKKILLK